MSLSGVDLAAVLASFDETWSPRTVGTVDDYDVRVVPRGVRHQPVSPGGADILLLEPSATVSTGATPSELTAERRGV